MSPAARASVERCAIVPSVLSTGCSGNYIPRIAIVKYQVVGLAIVQYDAMIHSKKHHHVGSKKQLPSWLRIVMGAIGGPLGGAVAGVLGGARGAELPHLQAPQFGYFVVGVGGAVGGGLGGVLGFLLGKLAKVDGAWNIGIKVGSFSGMAGALVGAVVGALVGAVGGIVLGGLTAFIVGIVLAVMAIMGKLSPD